MEIIKLKGTDKKLYSLVAPLVMNAEVLKQNNGFPFKTSEEHTWYVAVMGRKVVGFLPFIHKGSKKIYIDNYFIQNDDALIVDALLDEVTNDYYPDTDVSVLAHKRHVPHFKRNHFHTTKDWKNYETMQYEPEIDVQE